MLCFLLLRSCRKEKRGPCSAANSVPTTAYILDLWLAVSGKHNIGRWFLVQKVPAFQS